MTELRALWYLLRGGMSLIIEYSFYAARSVPIKLATNESCPDKAMQNPGGRSRFGNYTRICEPRQ